MNDGYDDSKPATVAVDVTNAAPVAASSIYDFGMQSNLQRAATVDGRFDTLTHEQGLVASDADGDAISFAVKTDPEHGSVEINHQTGDRPALVFSEWIISRMSPATACPKAFRHRSRAGKGDTHQTLIT